MTPSATVMPFFVGFIIVLSIAAVLLVGVLATATVRNRRVRLARHESIPTYYRGVLLSH